MIIALQNFARHVAEFRLETDRRLAAVQDRAHFILGPEVAEFERRFGAYIGVRYCLAVGNGTQAMEIALRTLPCDGGEVITAANAGMYATCAILSAGFIPAYCDIDPVLMTIDPESLRRAITERTRAVIVTHLYGQMADMDQIVKICRKAEVLLLEDCAEAHGAMAGTRKAGAFGDAGCFSFYPTKNLGAYGDGGAITTNDEARFSRMCSLRQYGWSRKYHADVSGGINSRLDEMQAAVLNVKLDRLDAMNSRRRAIAEYYNERLSDRGLFLPFVSNDHFIVHHYVLRSTCRERIMRALTERGIGSEIHFPIPDHRQVALGKQFSSLSLPNTENACNEVFTVPSFTEMSDAEVEFVASALAELYMP